MSSADLQRVWQRQMHSRCPVCGAKGFRRVRRIGDDIVHVCRKGHPYYIPGLTDGSVT